MPQTYLIVGASRGIGFEFTTQLLARGDTVIATERAGRARSAPSKLRGVKAGPYGEKLTVLECDVSNEENIVTFAGRVKELGAKGAVLEGGVIDVVVLNAGVLIYPNRVTEMSFSNFAQHLETNTIGPLITAQNLLRLSFPNPSSASQPSIDIKTLVFISSDSGSTTEFRGFEDGFAAYAASKAALNQGLRHLAAELVRTRSEPPTVLALHPGEVPTDMASISVDWEVHGVVTAKESIEGMLGVIAAKGKGGKEEDKAGEATFWTWEGRRYPW